MSQSSPIFDDEIALLADMPRFVRAHELLSGRVGPLARTPIPMGEEEIATAYLAYLAWIRARVPGGMLSGRPGYEAAETMRSRVFTAARRSGSFREFGSRLFDRLKLSISGLRQDDALWWRSTAAMLDEDGRWAAFATDTALSEVCTTLRLLDEWLRIVPDKRPVDDRWTDQSDGDVIVSAVSVEVTVGEEG